MTLKNQNYCKDVPITTGPGAPDGPCGPGAPPSPFCPVSPSSPLTPGCPSAPWLYLSEKKKM